MAPISLAGLGRGAAAVMTGRNVGEIQGRILAGREKDKAALEAERVQRLHNMTIEGMLNQRRLGQPATGTPEYYQRLEHEAQARARGAASVPLRSTPTGQRALSKSEIDNVAMYLASQEDKYPDVDTLLPELQHRFPKKPNDQIVGAATRAIQNYSMYKHRLAAGGGLLELLKQLGGPEQNTEEPSSPEQ